MHIAGVSALVLGGAALVLAAGRFAALPGVPVEPGARPAAARLAVEFRSYNLVPGTRAEFRRRVVEEAMPLLRRWEMDVVAHGPSLHDEDSYFLIRAFASVADRQREEDAFYGSADWREGPRERILELIESYTTVVLELDTAMVNALRRLGPREPAP